VTPSATILRQYIAPCAGLPPCSFENIFMMHAPSATPYPISRRLRQVARLIALTAVLSAAVVHADELGDVNQLMRSGKMAEALTRADQALAAKPRDPQMRFLKGVIQTESGKPNDAIATFLKLTEDFPELPEPYNNLAVLYAGQSQFDKARAALEMAIRTNPSYATAHENLGDVYAKLASQAYSKALQLDNNNAAVAPKLALIRTLFAPNAKGQRPTAPSPAAVPVPPTVAKAATGAPATAASTAAVPAAPKAVAAAPAPAPVAKAATENEVEAALRAWAAAWSAKDVNGYLAAYGKDFDTPGNQARKAWEDERRARIVGKSHIAVQLSNIAITVNGTSAKAKFRQVYSADSLKVSSRKTLDLVKSGDHWVIVKESTGT
jgi:tetratricopeptide (TPR) repeat protein